MADLGDLLGSLMCGLIRARRMADEQVAVLAEYYKDNPLLEGLAVPRIRIPELTIEMPVIIENHVEGESGEMEDPQKISSEVQLQLRSTLAINNIKVKPGFNKQFVSVMKKRLAAVKKLGVPVMKESVTRSVQDAFAEAAALTKTSLTNAQKETITKELRAKVLKVSITKQPIPSGLKANIKTADVKEGTTPASVTRLKITMKEEGLEWATQASESGGVIHRLQPE
ncbi:amidase [candidate division KSB1 bacterium]